VNGETPTPENMLRGFFGKVDLANTTEELARRIDANDSDSVSAIAFSPNGRFAYVAHQGAGTLSTYDLSAASLIQPGDGNTATFSSRIDVGHAPQGIVVSADGTRVYVANFLSRNVMVLSLTNPSAPLLLSTVSVTAETLAARIANGKRLFYRSKEPRHSRANYIACVSCHADGGGNDGRTWDFTHKGEGLRNTTDLRSRGGMLHGPVHWSANFDEIQDFENDIVNAFGGTGLAQDGQPPNPPLGAPNAGRSIDLDDLAAYVSSLTNAPPSPHRKQDGTLSGAALRGKALFNSPSLQCASCHVPPRFTDSTLTPNPTNYIFHDVGTLTPASGQRLGGPLPGIDTPSLLGAWNSAAYLHDGSAATLLDVLTTRDTNDQHGVTSTLTTNQLSDLVAYLQSIDGSANDEPEDLDNDGISDSWERRFGLDPQNTTDAALDFDNDGATNLSEFLAGTDPLEPNSRLRIHDTARTNNVVTFRFSTVPQKSYVAEYVTTLTSTNWLPLATIPGDGTEQSITDTNAFAVQRFYQVRVE
jgi:cytochrome c peroxidase